MKRLIIVLAISFVAVAFNAREALSSEVFKLEKEKLIHIKVLGEYDNIPRPVREKFGNDPKIIYDFMQSGRTETFVVAEDINYKPFFPIKKLIIQDRAEFRYTGGKWQSVKIRQKSDIQTDIFATIIFLVVCSCLFMIAFIVLCNDSSVLTLVFLSVQALGLILMIRADVVFWAPVHFPTKSIFWFLGGATALSMLSMSIIFLLSVASRRAGLKRRQIAKQYFVCLLLLVPAKAYLLSIFIANADSLSALDVESFVLFGLCFESVIVFAYFLAKIKRKLDARHILPCMPDYF
jgi:hypothetical protein